MINLIPKEEKKKRTADFFLRLSAIFLLMASFAVFIACVTILPAYILSLQKNSSVDQKLKIQKNISLPDLGERSLATAKDLDGKLSLMENAEKNEFPVSRKIINSIIFNKTSSIKITHISYENDGTLGKKISINGVASSRAALLSFSQALGYDSDFKKVDLPISNFVKESNIPFSLTLTPS
jgi:hypothetical protein